MSKKRSIWNNPFGGLFDFNRDGKESLGELWLAQKIFEECMKDEEEDADSDFADDLCDDGTEYGGFPEDYETEKEFREALCEVLKNTE